MAKPRTSTAVRFDHELHERLTKAAEERGVSINFCVNKAVAYWLDRLIPAEELRWTREPDDA